MATTIQGTGPKALVTLTVAPAGKAEAADRSKDPRTAPAAGLGRSDSSTSVCQVVATDGHPFWLADERVWVDARDLVAGDQLLTAGGERALVTAVRHWTALSRVHNLSITETHTYYVLAGTTPVLAHNCPSGGGAGASRWANRSEHAGDLGRKYTPGQSTRDPSSQWYHEMLSHDELLHGINHAPEGDGIVVSRGGTILGGHHRWDELQRRIGDGRIDPGTQIRIQVYDGE